MQASEIVPGQVYSFAMPFVGPAMRHVKPAAARHVCKVQVMERRAKSDGCQDFYDYFICRRIDNGHPVLAFIDDLSPP